MVLDTARPKYRENTTWFGTRGKDAVKKSTPVVNIFQVFTIDCQRSSSSWITTRNRMVRTEVQSGMNLRKKTNIQTHSRGKEKIPRTMVSNFEQRRQKWAYETSIWFSSRCLNEKSSTPRVRRTSWSACPSRSTKTHTTRTRIFLRHLSSARFDQHTGWQYWFSSPSSSLVARIRMELEVSSLFFLARISFLLQLGFVYSWWRWIVTDGVCELNVLTQRIFWYICKHFILVHNHGMAQDVATRVS